MINKSQAVEKFIKSLNDEDRKAVRHIADVCLTKDDTIKYGQETIMGLGGIVFDLLDGMKKLISNDLVVVEAPISGAGKLAVMVFKGTETEVIQNIKSLVEIAKVQTA